MAKIESLKCEAPFRFESRVKTTLISLVGNYSLPLDFAAFPTPPNSSVASPIC